jgi:hypothetical protein
MPDQPLRFPLVSETLASIQERQSRVLELRCELQEVIATSHDAIFRSLRLIAEINEALARGLPQSVA